MLRSAEKIFWPELPRVVVATYRTGATQLHVGVAFRPDEHMGRWVFLHQGFHLATHADEWTGGRYRGRELPPGVWSELRLPEEDLDALIATCEIVRERYAGSRNEQRGLPYAVRYEGGGFDRQGNLQLVSTTGRGLTCATFVLALCERIDIHLLDLPSWPYDRSGDTEWHSNIITLLEQRVHELGDYSEDLAHLEAVRQETPCARFRPEEVVAGVVLRELHPVHFDKASPLGAEIVVGLPPYAKSNS